MRERGRMTFVVRVNTFPEAAKKDEEIRAQYGQGILYIKKKSLAHKPSVKKKKKDWSLLSLNAHIQT